MIESRVIMGISISAENYQKLLQKSGNSIWMVKGICFKSANNVSVGQISYKVYI